MIKNVQNSSNCQFVKFSCYSTHLKVHFFSHLSEAARVAINLEWLMTLSKKGKTRNIRLRGHSNETLLRMEKTIEMSEQKGSPYMNKP